MQIIEKYFTGLSKTQEQQFMMLDGLYREWNSKINVVSRKDVENLYERHVLHSLGIAEVIQFKKNTTVLDAGTGGGFPGIPLAIMFPEAKFLLADSIAKKIKVVNEVSNALGLKNVEAVQARVENIKPTFDFIVSRAVARLPEFMNWCRGKIKKDNFNDLPNGILYLKGGDLKEELAQVKKSIKIYHLSDFFQEDFFETKKLVHLW
ncbi:MAG: 16S rRNA (guanine(527)-N(7))-methyltransferase RsmG [Bacteroidetes bacterium 4572_114]|nr:MAG: 16S rRNA (guanine(527)-N(7))-methyltransferase RsmG [Bacteroidetes bacterium 4572_114]